MTDYTELLELLRYCSSKSGCMGCKLSEAYDCTDDLTRDAAAAIEDLQAQLPKRGEWLPGREISRSYIGDCCVSIDFEDWRCSICGNIIEIPCNPKYNYCPNCGAKMEGMDASRPD